MALGASEGGPPGSTEVVLRDAATVMLVRDAPDGGGLEVAMLRRNLNSDFVGGAYVFPGGAVDDQDRHIDLEAVCVGRSDADASDRLGIDRGGLAFWVAAIRECFEEAGVLLARHADGRVVTFADPVIDARFIEHRRSVDSGFRQLVEVCADEELQLIVDDIYFFSHWITPEGAPRRYDTRFFVARAPEGQVPLHDDREVIANLWIRPSDALERHHAGEFDLVFPTMRSLMALERFASADAALDAAAAINEVPAILPRIVEDATGYRILLPGDDDYRDSVSAAIPQGIPMNTLNAPNAAVSVTGGVVGSSAPALSSSPPRAEVADAP